jgi:hypothetical protein
MKIERMKFMMNPGQEMFYNFFMERVIEGKEEEAKALLHTGFEMQAKGTFNAEYLKEAMPKYFDLIKPEFVNDLKNAMAHFGGNLK